MKRMATLKLMLTQLHILTLEQLSPVKKIQMLTWKMSPLVKTQKKLLTETHQLLLVESCMMPVLFKLCRGPRW